MKSDHNLIYNLECTKLLGFSCINSVLDLEIYGYCFLCCRQWDDKLLAEGTQLLEEEITVPSTAPGGQEEYRKTLVLSFFFKFYMKVLLELQERVW